MKVRAKTRCFVRNCLRQEGEIFDYEGPGNGCLEAVEEEIPLVAPTKKPPAGKKPVANAAFE